MGLLTSLFEFTLYVRISPERLTVRNPRTGEQIAEVPELAITRKQKSWIVAVGKEARSKAAQPNTRVINPFAHPRSLVSDFTEAEQLLKAFMRKMRTHGPLSVSPRVVLHPLGDPAGGFTQVEVRAFQEMAMGAGARSVKIWHGRPLTDQELISGQFPAAGRILN
ncbi:MAG: rod shape-determining protein [Gammaproteobacteria bacterium]|nr:rod shape-determining protein [Gammaproteobacteria bacterium]MBU1414175.1 rod shape-determining protein [Gammaproteobacteria bacterium]